jgi:hypothetical protein
MDRREALKMLPELSAGCLDAKTEAAVRRWVDECPDCRVEWQGLETLAQTLSSLPEANLSPEASQRMWARCCDAIYDKVESQRLSQQNPSLWSWMKSQPRWGWAMLGGAAVVLGTAMLAPEGPNEPQPVVASFTAPAGNDLEMFNRPPSYAASMVDHHAQMAADPFNDRVGSSLVSYSASSARR